MELSFPVQNKDVEKRLEGQFGRAVAVANGFSLTTALDFHAHCGKTKDVAKAM